jgi:hypothetical protein
MRMATLMPMDMIFVPSIGGISRSPKELTALAGLRTAPTFCERWLELAG